MALTNDDMVYIRLADNEGETAQSSVHVAQQTSDVAREALFDAIEAVTLGYVVEKGYNDRMFDDTTRRSPSTLAQADIRWRIVYTGAVSGTNEYSMPIGTADLTLKKDGEELMDNTAAEYTALETAFNAIAKLPDQSQAAKLLRVEYYKA
jgi:hypothetical protein